MPSTLGTNWRQRVNEYDRFYAEQINSILAEHSATLANLSRMRRELERALEEVASFQISTPHEAAQVLEIAIELSFPADTAQNRAARNVLDFLRRGPPFYTV